MHLPLEANGVLIHWEDQAFCLLQLDVLSVGRRVRDAVASAVADLFPPHHLFLCASHTHFAPNVDPSIPLLGDVDDDYVAFVIRELIELVRSLARQGGPPAVLSESTAIADLAVNRRKRCWEVSRPQPYLRRKTLTLPNPHGKRESRIQVIRFHDRTHSDATIAVLWNYACHPVGMPDLSAISSEFPGVVRNYIRAEIGSPISVLFLPGFMGDLRPRIVDDSWAWCHTFGEYLHRFFEGPRFRPFSMAEWEQWANELATAVARAAVEATPRRGVLPEVSRTSQPLDQLVEGASPDRELSAHYLGLNAELALVGLSAEVLSGYGRYLDPRRWGGRRIVPVGYLDAVVGYLPTRRDLTEGGYEVSESRSFFGLPSPFRPDIEVVIEEMMRHVNPHTRGL